jgi:hypothetical protein
MLHNELRKVGETDQEWGDRLTRVHGQAEKARIELQYLIEALQRDLQNLELFLEGDGKGGIPSEQSGLLRHWQFIQEVTKAHYLIRVEDWGKLTIRERGDQ